MGSFYSEIYREKRQAPNQEWQDLINFEKLNHTWLIAKIMLP
jgi:hypothetical protein